MSGQWFSVFQRNIVSSSSRVKRFKHDFPSNASYSMNPQRISYLNGEVKIKVKLPLCFIRHCAKTYMEIEVLYIVTHSYLWSHMEVGGKLYAQATLLPRKSQPSSCWIGAECAPKPVLSLCLCWEFNFDFSIIKSVASHHPDKNKV
jgi:hypothetical protein